MRRLWWFFLAYGLVLLLLAPRLSFWLDEVLTLAGATQPDLPSLMENLRKQQGATPLAFLIPRWSIQLFGLSELSARLPSILAAVASLPALYRIAQRAGVEPRIAVLLFALWPLQFRYALEVRPYALAQCLALWLTVAFLSKSHWSVYGVLTIAIGLTHPYALAVPAAHLIWSIYADRSRLATSAIALVLTGLALAPWYAHFSAGWRAQSAEQQLSMWNTGAVLVFLREISGSGYIGTAILGAGLAVGFRRTPELRPLWLLWGVIPVVAVPFANIAFDYFFAIRQFIYILPPLALFLAAGRYTVPIFLLASLYGDVVWLLRPREDWSAASNTIAAEISKGACVQFVGDSQKLFVFFRPELADRRCAANAPRIVLAGSTYESAQQAGRDTLVASGLTKQSERSFVAPIVEVYSR